MSIVIWKPKVLSEYCHKQSKLFEEIFSNMKTHHWKPLKTYIDLNHWKAFFYEEITNIGLLPYRSLVCKWHFATYNKYWFFSSHFMVILLVQWDYFGEFQLEDEPRSTFHQYFTLLAELEKETDENRISGYYEKLKNCWNSTLHANWWFKNEERLKRDIFFYIVEIIINYFATIKTKQMYV